MWLVLQFCVPIKKVGGDFALNIFETVKQSVTTRQVTERYGIKVGRNGMACCPFHKDRTPSMKVDECYYCFGCGALGVAHMLSIPIFDFEIFIVIFEKISQIMFAKIKNRV